MGGETSVVIFESEMAKVFAFLLINEVTMFLQLLGVGLLSVIYRRSSKTAWLTCSPEDRMWQCRVLMASASRNLTTSQRRMTVLPPGPLSVPPTVLIGKEPLLSDSEACFCILKKIRTAEWKIMKIMKIIKSPSECMTHHLLSYHSATHP